MKLFAVHDKKAKSLSVHHVLRDDAVAMRSFQDAVLSKDSVYGRYAEDFELVCLAELSDDTGSELPLVDPIVGLHVVITALSIVQLASKSDAAPIKLEA